MRTLWYMVNLTLEICDKVDIIFRNNVLLCGTVYLSKTSNVTYINVMCHFSDDNQQQINDNQDKDISSNSSDRIFVLVGL